MEFDKLECSGCGSANVEFDPRSRRLICNQCGNEEVYSRKRVNSGAKVIYSRDNAIRFFMDNNYSNAGKYAQDVLNISIDNAPALYIISYIEEFDNKKRGNMEKFFTVTRDLPLDYNEVEELKKLFLASPYKLIEHEEEFIRLIAINSQDESDKKDLCNFIDAISPYLIAKRPGISYLTAELAEMYSDLAGHCNIPKTCFALLDSIEKNPDSPYRNNTFSHTARNKYFYENYILPIGNIVKSINDTMLREKFVAAYNFKVNSFNKNTNI